MSTLADLQRARRRERRLLIALCVPTLALLTVVMFVPLIWLSSQSFFDEGGRLTLENYSRLVTDASYRSIFRVTFEISAMVVVLCALIGYPLAYCLSQCRPIVGNLLLLCVLVPFWTPVLVRTYAWLVLLQRRGVINDTLLELGIILQPLQLANNRISTVIGMVHIMLPYLVLPVYASMRAIPDRYLQASASLGASPTGTFWRVFFPLSLPGFASGILLVFVLSLGFYVTPALLGGGRVIMLAHRIADSVTVYSTWGPAAALGVALFVLAGGTIYMFTRVFGRPSAIIE